VPFGGGSTRSYGPGSWALPWRWGTEAFDWMMLSGRNRWHDSPGLSFPPGLGVLDGWPGWKGAGSDEPRPCDCLCCSNLGPFAGCLMPKLTWCGGATGPLEVSCTPAVPETFSLLSSLQWQGETQEFCPNAKIVLVGCKLDMRTDLNTLRELSKQRLIPVTHEQVCFSCHPCRARGGEVGAFLQELLV